MNEPRRKKLGSNARKTFEDNQGAVNKVMMALEPFIKT